MSGTSGRPEKNLTYLGYMPTVQENGHWELFSG